MNVNMILKINYKTNIIRSHGFESPINLNFYMNYVFVDFYKMNNSDHMIKAERVLQKAVSNVVPFEHIAYSKFSAWSEQQGSGYMN